LPPPAEACPLGKQPLVEPIISDASHRRDRRRGFVKSEWAAEGSAICNLQELNSSYLRNSQIPRATS